MGVIRERPDPSRTHAYPDLEPFAPHWLAASAGLTVHASWPARFTDWNGLLGEHAERVVQGVRNLFPAALHRASPTSLLARLAVDRALAVTREAYFEPIPDREGAIDLVRQTCEGEAPFDAAFVRSLGVMLVHRALQGSGSGRFRSHEAFAKSHEWFRACCPARDVDSAIDRYIETLGKAVDHPPAMGAGWAYAHFNYVHPFTNGNGRVSRVLASMVFMQRGWPPICYQEYDNLLLYSVFQQLFEQGPAVRAHAFTVGFAEIHARSVARLGG